MLHKTKGIVLKQVKYTDSSSIVTIYTQIFGRQSYIVKGIRNKTGRMGPIFWQPFSLLELEVYHRQKKELQSIKEVQLALPLYGITTDIFKNTIAQFLAEVLFKVLREEEENVELFDYLFKGICYLDQTLDKVSEFHIHFMVHLCKYLGFFFHTNYQEDYYFNLKSGSFSSSIPAHSYFMDKEYSFLLNQFILKDTYDFKQNSVLLNSFSRNILIEKLIDYFQLHMEGVGTIKSFTVLQELFKN